MLEGRKERKKERENKEIYGKVTKAKLGFLLKRKEREREKKKLTCRNASIAEDLVLKRKERKKEKKILYREATIAGDC